VIELLADDVGALPPNPPSHPLRRKRLIAARRGHPENNLTLKPVIEMMSKSLSARTVNKYVEYIKQVVKSLKAPNGEPMFSRIWDAETMDLPIVEYS
jgi:hypothetical protein